MVRYERNGAGFHPALFIIEVSQIVLEEAHLPDLVLDLSDSYGLAGERGREVDFASANADATTAGDADGAIVERVVWLSRSAE